MAISATIAAVGAVGAVQANKVKHSQIDAANEQLAQAKQTQAAQQAQANKDLAQTQMSANQQMKAEADRATMMADAEAQRAAEPTTLTPTVQLASDDGDASAGAARKRRAAFRPEYTSGVSI